MLSSTVYIESYFSEDPVDSIRLSLYTDPLLVQSASDQRESVVVRSAVLVRKWIAVWIAGPILNHNASPPPPPPRALTSLQGLRHRGDGGTREPPIFESAGIIPPPIFRKIVGQIR